MMVMDEWCDKWSKTNAGSFYADFDKVWQKDLTSFIERDRNHPSIVIWSLGNEVAAARPVPAYIPDTLKYLVPFAKKLDNTRPYTHACVSGWSDAPGLARLAEVEDVVGVNYQDFLFGAIHKSNPNAVICGTEQDPYLARSSKAPDVVSRCGTCPMSSGTICGRASIIWASPADSLGGTSGFLENCGFRKSWFYYQQSQWSDAPMVHITIGNGTGTDRHAHLAENWNQTGPVERGDLYQLRQR